MSKPPRHRHRATITVPDVTDHAIVRYLQRAKGFDMEAVRVHIADVCRTAVEAGARTLKTEGVEFIFKNRTVVTVTPTASDGT